MAANRVLFLKGSSQNYALEVKNENAMYFCTDTKELYVGSTRFGLGDMGIKFIDSSDGTTELTGDAINGKVVTKIEKDPSTNYRTLKVFLGTGVTGAAKEEIIAAIDAMTSHSTVLEYKPDNDHPDSEYGDIDLVVDNPSTPSIGDVTFTKGANGLSAEVTKLGVKGIASGEKGIILDTSSELLSTNFGLRTAAGSGADAGKTFLQLISKGADGLQTDVLAEMDADDFIKDGMLESAEINMMSSAAEVQIEGYYHNGAFYEEDTHATLITPEAGKIYIDLGDNRKRYKYENDAYAADTSAVYPFLVFTWNADSEKSVTSLNLKEVITPYAAGTGIAISGNKISTNPGAASGSDDETSFQFTEFGSNKTLSGLLTEYDASSGLVKGSHSVKITLPGLSGSAGTAGDTIVTYVAIGNGSSGANNLTGDTLNIRKTGLDIDDTLVHQSANATDIPNVQSVYDTVQDAIAVWSTFGA